MVAAPFLSGTAAGRSVALAAGRSVALTAGRSVVQLGGEQGLGRAAGKPRPSARYGLAAMAGNLTDRE
jgi:uncharacterized protein (DUF2345 family)